MVFSRWRDDDLSRNVGGRPAGSNSCTYEVRFQAQVSGSLEQLEVARRKTLAQEKSRRQYLRVPPCQGTTEHVSNKCILKLKGRVVDRSRCDGGQKGDTVVLVQGMELAGQSRRAGHKFIGDNLAIPQTSGLVRSRIRNEFRFSFLETNQKVGVELRINGPCLLTNVASGV